MTDNHIRYVIDNFKDNQSKILNFKCHMGDRKIYITKEMFV